MRGRDDREADGDGAMKIVVIVKRGRDHEGKRKPRLVWGRIGPVSEQHLPGPFGEEDMPAIQLTDSQQIALSVAPVDKKGNPAEVQGLTWTSSDPATLTVTQDGANPNSAKAVAQKPGAAQVQVSADADLGDGTMPISATQDFVVTGGPAVGFSIVLGTPEEQP